MIDDNPDIDAEVDEDFVAAVPVDIAVNNVREFEATAPVEDVDIAADKPIRSRPKTSNKFGRGKRRGGNCKSTVTIDLIVPAPQAADVGLSNNNNNRDLQWEWMLLESYLSLQWMGLQWE